MGVTRTTSKSLPPERLSRGATVAFNREGASTPPATHAAGLATACCIGVDDDAPPRAAFTKGELFMVGLGFGLGCGLWLMMAAALIAYSCELVVR